MRCAILIVLGAFCAVTLHTPATVTAASIAAVDLPPAPSVSGFKIPPGIFALHAQIFDTSASIYSSDTDDFVPYRSDAHDQFSWALMRQVLLPTSHDSHDNASNNHNTSDTSSNNNCTNSIAAGVNGNCSTPAAVNATAADNIIFSPFTVKLVLALLAEAAGNGTRAQHQLLTSLGNNKELTNLRNFYLKALVALKADNPHYTLNLETRLYADAAVQPRPRYRELLQTYYDTTIAQLNFSDSQATADDINAWVEEATAGRLQQLVTQDGVKHSVMLLVNVIYFKGLWRRQFSDTYTSVFFRAPEQPLKVTYMEQTDTFYYHESEELQAKLLRLPYKGHRFAMYILLPHAEQSVDALFRRMREEQLQRMQWQLERTKVKLVLPKFKYGHKTDLKAILRRMGIVDIFGDSASLTELADDASCATGAGEGKQLSVSNILQKSGIDVSERGTEAFAATEVQIENRFGGSESIEEFIVNRPFMFFIMEEGTANILFAGKVYEPLT